MPPTLLEAFAGLKVVPILVGGGAVQVWAGRRDGLFATSDLDLLAPMDLRRLAEVGIQFGASGRHALVEGVPIEFPSGPLGVGDLILSEEQGTVVVPCASGGFIRCIRPEACVLDRLAWVAGDRSLSAYQQALGVGASQSGQPGWDWEWSDKAAAAAGLQKLWRWFRADLEQIQSGHPDPARALEALRLGWG